MPDTVFTRAVLHIVLTGVVHGIAGSINCLIRSGTNIDPEPEVGFVRISSISAMDFRRFPKISPKPLRHGQRLLCAVGDVIVVDDLLTPGNSVFFYLKVLQSVGTSDSGSLKDLSIRRYLIIGVWGDPAFHKIVFRIFRRQLNGGCLAGSQEINPLIAYAVHIVFCLVWYWFLRSCIQNRRVISIGLCLRPSLCLHKPGTGCIPVPDLERERCTYGIGSAHFLLKLNLPVDIRCQVEAHVKIGSAGAALHVEHLHGVAGEILEDCPAVLEEAVQISRNLVFCCARILFQVCFSI